MLTAKGNALYRARISSSRRTCLRRSGSRSELRPATSLGARAGVVPASPGARGVCPEPAGARRRLDRRRVGLARAPMVVAARPLGHAPTCSSLFALGDGPRRRRHDLLCVGRLAGCKGPGRCRAPSALDGKAELRRGRQSRGREGEHGPDRSPWRPRSTLRVWARSLRGVFAFALAIDGWIRRVGLRRRERCEYRGRSRAVNGPPRTVLHTGGER
jgi:hypothetical protein